MDTTLLLVILIIAVVASTVIILLQLNKARQKPEDDKAMLLLQNQLNALNKTLDNRLATTTRTLDSKLDNTNAALQKQFGINTQMLQRMSTDTNQTVKNVTERLTKLDDTNKRVVEFATQLQSLENILKNPKHRGILGEFFLEDLLSKVMPQGTYATQYKFHDGEIVDAILKIRDKIIPIDAKFSLEKYNQIQEENDKLRREDLEKQFKTDLKNRIDETSKYIRPDEGTTDFAMMFIPAEGIFYNLLMHKVGTVKVSSEDLITYAFKKKVIIVSPNTFFAYLQTILQALKALQVEESIKGVIKNVQVLSKHLTNYNDYFGKLGKHLGTTVGAYNSASKEFAKVDRDVLKIAGVGGQAETELLEKPEDYE